MPISCHTHHYDGQLRDIWREKRQLLLDKYLDRCVSFDDTIKEIEVWLEHKYVHAKRIRQARRSIDILRTQKNSNFDQRNEIDVEELLPIVWQQVKGQDDVHEIFYEQLCDITGGSCAQGRSTRLFQLLFLVDVPSHSSNDSSSTDGRDETLANPSETDEVRRVPIREDDVDPQSDRPSTTPSEH
jgi:hypothetical protein